MSKKPVQDGFDAVNRMWNSHKFKACCVLLYPSDNGIGVILETELEDWTESLGAKSMMEGLNVSFKIVTCSLDKQMYCALVWHDNIISEEEASAITIKRLQTQFGGEFD